MKTYLIRSLKYLIWLFILFTVILTVMVATGTSRLDAGESVTELFMTSRGQMMLIVIVVLALLYPRFGFTSRDVRANMPADRERLIQIFETSGFVLVAEEGSRMVFRARTPLKKAMLLWEDRITVESDEKYVKLDGIRKEVVRLEFRLKPVLNRPETADEATEV